MLVTAAAGAGIGFAVAKRAAEEGCRALFISDVHERRLNEAVEAIRQATGLQAVHGQLCDVSQEDQVQSLIDAAHAQMGGIDVLVNNAGLGTSRRIVDMAKEAFGRGAEPWEVANVMIFLASGYSSYMTGEVVSVSSQHA